MVDNLDNGGQLAGEGAAADEQQTANLNEPPRGELQIDIGHGDGFLTGSQYSAFIQVQCKSSILTTGALTVD